MAYATYYAQNLSKLISDQTNPITLDREVMRVWPQYKDALAASIKQEMDATIYSYAAIATRMGTVTSDGRVWRVVKRQLAEDAKLAGYPQGIVETLRLGFATTINWDEARLFGEEGSHGNATGTQEFVPITDPKTGVTTEGSIAHATSDDGARLIIAKFYNVSTFSAQACITSLLNAETKTFTTDDIQNETPTGEWDIISASAEKADDASSIITVYLAQDTYVLNTKERVGLPNEAEVFTVYGVAKQYAQSIIDSWMAIGTGRGASASFSQDSKRVNIALSRLTGGNKVEKPSAVVDFSTSCLFERDVKMYWGLTDAEKDAILTANEATDGVEVTPQVSYDLETERWDVILNFTTQVKFKVDEFTNAETNATLQKETQYLGYTSAQITSDITLPTQDTNLNIAIDKRKNANCTWDITVRTTASKEIELATYTRKETFFGKTETAKKLNTATPYTASAFAEGKVEQITKEPTEFKGRFNSEKQVDTSTAQTVEKTIAETAFDKTILRRRYNQPSGTVPEVPTPDYNVSGSLADDHTIASANVDVNDDETLGIAETRKQPKCVIVEETYHTKQSDVYYKWVINATKAQMEADKPNTSNDYETNNVFDPIVNEHGLYNYTLKKITYNPDYGSSSGFETYTQTVYPGLVMRGRTLHKIVVYLKFTGSKKAAYDALNAYTDTATIDSGTYFKVTSAGRYSGGVEQHQGGWLATAVYEAVAATLTVAPA